MTSSPSSGLTRMRPKALFQITASMLGAFVLEREIAVAGGMRPADSRRFRRARAHSRNASSTVRFSAADSSETVHSTTLIERRCSVMQAESLAGLEGPCYTRPDDLR